MKQGDALSCILFILGIEPLIRSIQADPALEKLKYHGVEIPTILSYADDVACITKPSQRNLNIIFSHYEKMTEVSGLKLNADKTEQIQKVGNLNYDVNYMGEQVRVKPSDIIKINGLHLSFEVTRANDLNLNKIFTSMEGQFKMWKNMYLSIIGKILIYKTFGLSQILFIAATTLIPLKMEKKINELIYRFIWSSNFEKNKAPDRIKRSILSTPLNKLGFDMLDYKEIVKSIRLKAYVRLMTTELHPLNLILKNSLTNSIVNIELINSINPVLEVPSKETFYIQ